MSIIDLLLKDFHEDPLISSIARSCRHPVKPCPGHRLCQLARNG